MPEIVLIAAVAEENRVIGDGLELPWHLPDDLARFKRLTHGHPLLMGRHTFRSIVHQFGGPLPERRHLVLTHLDGGLPADFPGVETAASIDEALRRVSRAERLFVGGGASVYEAFLAEPFRRRVDRLELTLVEGCYGGDTYFPEWRPLVGSVFEKTAETPNDGFRFVTYERVAGGA
ncbi:MAG: dihydrofolate reductase [Bacteroidetes bacterium QS_8_68_15]|nr:MAG: dihydrofolate reductase [Bacteroidetes bacterium QS_8_68_15]